MDICLGGFKENCGQGLTGDLIIHKNRRMTESETRMAVNYGIEKGYRNASEIPDEIVDKICDPNNHEFEKYDDTPDFVTLPRLETVLRNILTENWRYGFSNEQIEDLINEITDEV